MSIVYSSNNQKEIFDKIYNHISCMILNNNIINDINFSRIKHSLFHICDVTPLMFDNNLYIDFDTLAIMGSSFNNGILICEKKYKKKLCISDNIIYYDSKKNNYHLELINDIINVYSNNYNLWLEYNYILSEDFLLCVNSLLDINYNNYQIKYNITYKQLIIIFNHNDNKRILDIKTKLLCIQNKIIDLIDFIDIYKELQHLEILLNFKF